MAHVGTQEIKRSAKAVPPPLEPRLSLGCVGVLALYLLLWVLLVAAAPAAWSVALGVPALLIVLVLSRQYLYEQTLLALVRFRWSNTGVRCLVIHSRSPKWDEHVQTEWLARLGAKAVTLNWSDRSTWRRTLAVRAFRHFCGEIRNFNPAVVVFRGFKKPYVFRFFYAFQQAQAGRIEYLERLEAEMFRLLDIDAGRPPIALHIESGRDVDGPDERGH